MSSAHNPSMSLSQFPIANQAIQPHPTYPRKTTNPNFHQEVRTPQIATIHTNQVTLNQKSDASETNPCFQTPPTSKANYANIRYMIPNNTEHQKNAAVQQNISLNSSVKSTHISFERTTLEGDQNKKKETEKSKNNSEHDEMKLVEDFELNCLNYYMEAIGFVNHNDKMNNLWHRTFMKFVSNVLKRGICDNLVKFLFNIILRKTLSIVNGTLNGTKMCIRIYHPSLVNGQMCYDEKTYECFNGQDLVKEINIMRHTYPMFKIDDNFRIQVDVGMFQKNERFHSLPHPKYVTGSTRTLLRAVSIAFAYNWKVHGDEKFRENFKRTIKDDKYQEEVSKNLQKFCNIDDYDAESGNKIIPRVAECFPNLRIIIISRDGLRVYNETMTACITLSETDGQFDAVLPYGPIE